MTDRQSHILIAIIEQYAEIAAPVGSVMLAKLFGVSSATIRSEMVKLEHMGYIMLIKLQNNPIRQNCRLWIVVQNL